MGHIPYETDRTHLFLSISVRQAEAIFGKWGSRKWTIGHCRFSPAAWFSFHAKELKPSAEQHAQADGRKLGDMVRICG